jgi:hypothetical protein
LPVFRYSSHRYNKPEGLHIRPGLTAPVVNRIGQKIEQCIPASNTVSFWSHLFFSPVPFCKPKPCFKSVRRVSFFNLPFLRAWKPILHNRRLSRLLDFTVERFVHSVKPVKNKGQLVFGIIDAVSSNNKKDILSMTNTECHRTVVVIVLDRISTI